MSLTAVLDPTEVNDVIAATADRLLQTPPPTRDEVIAKIMEETGHTSTEATALYGMLARVNAYFRSLPGEIEWRELPYHLDDEDLKIHGIFAAVMPDDVGTEGHPVIPGSAHDLACRHFRPEGGFFVHGQAGTEVRNCAVYVTYSETT